MFKTWFSERLNPLGQPPSLFSRLYLQSRPPTSPQNRVSMPKLAVSMRDGRFQGPCLEDAMAEMIGTPLTHSRTWQALEGSQHLCRNSNCSGASAVGC